MSGVIGNLRMDLRRAFISPAFLFSSVGMAAVLFFNAANEFKINSSCSVLYLDGIMESNYFYSLAMLFCAVPFAASFCADWSNQFIRPSCIRSGPRQYCISKVIACALSGGSVVAFGHILVYFLLLLRFPLARASDIQNMILNEPVLGCYLQGRQYLMYLLCKLIFQFEFYAFLAVLAFFISTFIPNIFVVLASPLLAYYFLLNLEAELHLPTWLDIRIISEGQCNLGNTAVSVLYALVFFSVLCAVLGTVAVKNVKGRLQHA